MQNRWNLAVVINVALFHYRFLSTSEIQGLDLLANLACHAEDTKAGLNENHWTSLTQQGRIALERAQDKTKRVSDVHMFPSSSPDKASETVPSVEETNEDEFSQLDSKRRKLDPGVSVGSPVSGQSGWPSQRCHLSDSNRLTNAHVRESLKVEEQDSQFLVIRDVVFDTSTQDRSRDTNSESQPEKDELLPTRKVRQVIVDSKFWAWISITWSLLEHELSDQMKRHVESRHGKLIHHLPLDTALGADEEQTIEGFKYDLHLRKRLADLIVFLWAVNHQVLSILGTKKRFMIPHSSSDSCGKTILLQEDLDISRLAVMILGCYYKNQNIEKWSFLFKVDERFLIYLLNKSTELFHRDSLKAKKSKSFGSFKTYQIVPWKTQMKPELKLLNLELGHRNIADFKSWGSSCCTKNAADVAQAFSKAPYQAKAKVKNDPQSFESTSIRVQWTTAEQSVSLHHTQIYNDIHPRNPISDSRSTARTDASTLHTQTMPLNSDPSTSTLIGVGISVAGNLMISVALNVQKLAHQRLEPSEPRPAKKPSEATPLMIDEPQELHAPPTDLESPRSVSPASSSSSRAQSYQPNDLAYLSSPLWWLGFVIMSTGELGNFVSYGFAPASVVAPLGTVALVGNCVAAPVLLGERFKKRDWLGIGLVIIGTITIVLSSPRTSEALSPDQLARAIRQLGFILYAALCLSAILLLICLSSTQWANRFIGIDVGLCAISGGFTVLSTKAFSSLLNVLFLDCFHYSITWIMLAVMLVTAVLQIVFLNRALQRFDSKASLHQLN
ncbi:uncharacterized protein PGTG_09928 [Puccinia graminis f. sp. tritici CRL 75-36-700-3]|uniref:Uncharacterized protein n=1 Tax=Puccinia graminis f. sp. tritici (strain CRL 75-36-700-3 / race SCCL) TaxID=418459 RepID=E3KFD3_PUCGT|nr:uncharacterized protein PGTG_09928 [Puccinia graminis f. sp. tritici CRL 75-36-700-3]EFP82960.2 hypothetical protein PGTG_09928 [Puccinia graminis f. sp. tritici CRL 75-36-700-3]